MVCRALGLGCGACGQHDPAAARPPVRRGQLRGEEQAEATQATGDDVGAVAAEDLGLLRRHHHAAAPAARDVEQEFAGVLGVAHCPDRGGRIGQRVVSALRCGQDPVRDELVHRGEQLVDPVGLA